MFYTAIHNNHRYIGFYVFEGVYVFVCMVLKGLIEELLSWETCSTDRNDQNRMPDTAGKFMMIINSASSLSTNPYLMKH